MPLESWTVLDSGSIETQACAAFPCYPPEHFGHVYAIEIEGGLVKVGVSRKPAVRIPQIRSDAARLYGAKLGRAMVSRACCNYWEVEGLAHRALDQYRSEGEYFRCDFEMVARTLHTLILEGDAPEAAFEKAVKLKTLRVSLALYKQVKLLAIEREMTIAEMAEEVLDAGIEFLKTSHLDPLGFA